MDDPHTDSTVYGLLMLGVFSVAFALANLGGPRIPILGCAWPVLALPVVYALILRREHRQHAEAQTVGLSPSEQELAILPATRFYGMLGLLCGLIMGGGILLSILGSRMALPPDQGGFGLEASLIGTIFLAISTSLPELVISFASVRLGFLNMAVGNVLGSNMFNLLIIFVADISMRKGSLLENASSKHWTSVGLILILTFLAGALLRTKSRKASVPVAASMLILYIAAMALFM